MKNTPRSMIRMILPTLLVLLWTASVAVVVQAQSPNYDNYGYDNDGMDDNNYQQEQQQQEDSLYHDYAMRQQEKGGAGAAGVANAVAGGGVWTKVAASGAVGWLLGAKYHSKKLRKTLQAQHKADQKQLYQQYYNDVYALQLQNAELLAALEQYYGIGGTGSSGSGGTKASGAAGGTAQQQQQQRRIQ